jgi:hypothetical protein
MQPKHQADARIQLMQVAVEQAAQQQLRRQPQRATATCADLNIKATCKASKLLQQASAALYNIRQRQTVLLCFNRAAPADADYTR